MKKILPIAALIPFFMFGCGREEGAEKLQQNTEYYFKAHGIVQGQPNELRIGDTLFRFPAGVGLNPYTAQGTSVLANGGEGVPLEKKPHKIVRGRADKVTIYLDAARGYIPWPDPFPGGKAVRVEISKWGAPVGPGAFEKAIRDKPIVVEHPSIGLREYRSEKKWLGSIYESTTLEFQVAADGEKLFFGCQPSDLPMSGLCGTSYWMGSGKYSLSMAMDKSFFMANWQDAYPAVVSFVGSVAAK